MPSVCPSTCRTLLCTAVAGATTNNSHGVCIFKVVHEALTGDDEDMVDTVLGLVPHKPDTVPRQDTLNKLHALAARHSVPEQVG